MLNIFYTSQFKKDYKKAKKQQKELPKLQVVIEHLVNKEPLDPKYKDHYLIGNWKNHSECHIEAACNTRGRIAFLPGEGNIGSFDVNVVWELHLYTRGSFAA